MTSIFVAKLDFGVTQEQLKQAFETYGKVAKVTIATDKETGKPRGFAFVEMFDEQEANSAIEALDGHTFNGRQMVVKKADDRSNSKPASQKQNNFTKPTFKNEFKSEYKSLDEEPKKSFPTINPEEIIDVKKKEFKKKSKDKSKDLADGRPKQQKMAAYKKSGKNNRFIDFDDEDDY